MPAPTLELTYTEAKTRVGLYLGWARTESSHTSTNNTDFAAISASAMREFFFPAIDVTNPTYEWSFLRKAAQITLVAADFDYDLPADFSGTILDSAVTYASNVDNHPLRKVSEDTIRKQRARDSQDTGPPRYFAIRNKAHTPTTGQLWEMLVYPTPGSDEVGVVLDYRYVFMPDAFSTTNLYFSGGTAMGEVILAAHFAAAERIMESDPAGPYNNRFQTLLATAVRSDMQLKANVQAGKA